MNQYNLLRFHMMRILRLHLWYIYKYLRKDLLGKKMVFFGIWRVLNESEEDWKITNNKCYWYKSYQDLSIDYYEGKCSVENGEVALK